MSKFLSLSLTALVCCVMMTLAYGNYYAMYPTMKGGMYYGGGGGYGGGGYGGGGFGGGGIMQFFFMLIFLMFFLELFRGFGSDGSSYKGKGGKGSY